MKKLFINLIFFLFFSAELFSQTESVSLLGKEAPNINFDNILNYKKESGNLSDYRGKILILDFWATWCAPCLKSFPHLESLQSEFPEDLQVFTVTSDSQKRIKKFLTKFKTKLPIVIDSSQVIRNHFPHRSIPHSVVINKAGNIKIVSTPEQITAKHIQELLADKDVDLKEKIDNTRFNPKQHLSPDNAMFQFTITPYQQGSAMTSYANGRYLFHNLGLKTLHEKVRGFPISTRTVWEVKNKDKYKWGKENAYCLEIIAPLKTEEEVFQFVFDYLNNNFNLRSKIEKRKTPVKLLRRTNSSLNLTESNLQGDPNVIMSGRGIKSSNATIDQLANYLEAYAGFKIPVIDETGLTGNYQIDIPLYQEDPDYIYEELNKVGLELVDEEREIDLLILYEHEETLNNN